MSLGGPEGGPLRQTVQPGGLLLVEIHHLRLTLRNETMQSGSRRTEGDQLPASGAMELCEF